MSVEIADTVCLSYEDGLEIFRQELQVDDVIKPNQSVCAVKTLIYFLRGNKDLTVSQVVESLKGMKYQLESVSESVSVTAVCENFTQFITLVAMDTFDVEQCRAKMISRGITFYKRTIGASSHISKLGFPFIRDEVLILTHSYSRVVFNLIQKASEAKRRIKIIVTKADRPAGKNNPSVTEPLGEKMIKMLDGIGVPCSLILDSAVGYFMDKVDLVLVGAEGLVENGGIINQIGSYQIAIIAKAFNKPFYAAAESFKFIRMYPIKQDDLDHLNPKDSGSLERADSSLLKSHPWVDYTPPSYVSLLFTDLGILTPSAVSDELIRLYP